MSIFTVDFTPKARFLLMKRITWFALEIRHLKCREKLMSHWIVNPMSFIELVRWISSLRQKFWPWPRKSNCLHLSAAKTILFVSAQFKTFSRLFEMLVWVLPTESIVRSSAYRKVVLNVHVKQVVNENTEKQGTRWNPWLHHLLLASMRTDGDLL